MQKIFCRFVSSCLETMNGMNYEFRRKQWKILQFEVDGYSIEKSGRLVGSGKTMRIAFTHAFLYFLRWYQETDNMTDKLVVKVLNLTGEESRMTKER